MRAWPLVALIVVPLAGCISGGGGPDAFAGHPSTITDPTAPGSLTWDHHVFELEPRIVMGGPGLSPYLVIPEGSVHLPEGDGAHPVLLLMHGRHGTCRYVDTFELLGFPCPELASVSDPVDSFTGYDYLAENLASHGYIVASLSANHINDRDNDFGIAGDVHELSGTPYVVGDDFGATARARVLLSFLDDLRDVEEGAGPEPLRFLQGRIDLDRVGLMGHSRGGEGVARAISLNAQWPQPHALRAAFALAPIDFDDHVVVGVPFAVLLPYCDGDVFNLQGAWIYDDSRYADGAGPLHQFLTLGANHNWYNTVWTGSDWTNRDDPHCDLDAESSGRDTAESQRAHGLAIMAAFLRAYVGPEPALLPYLTGEQAFRQAGVVTTYHPPAAERFVLHDGASPRAGEHAFTGTVERTPCTGGDCPIVRTYSRAEQVHLEWDGAARWTVGLVPGAAAGFDRVAVRVGFDHEGPEDAADDVVLEVTAGAALHRKPLSELGAFHPPGGSGAKTTLNMVALDLADAGIDGAAVDGVSLVFEGRGSAQFTDWMLQRVPTA